MKQQEHNIDKIISDLSELQTRLSEMSLLVPLSKKATVNNNEQPSERRRSEEKRPSWWVRVKEKLKHICKVKNEATNHASDIDDNQGASRRIRRYIDDGQEDVDLEILKLLNDVGQMISALKNLTEFETSMSKSLERVHSINIGAILLKTESFKSLAHDLKTIRRKISALKCRIPSLLYKQSSSVVSIADSLTAIEEINETGSDIYLPGLHIIKDFIYSSAFEDVVEKFQGLDFTHKLCLLSFAVFPENREVRKTMLMYWWIGEGFINCDDSENSVTRILDEFSAKRVLEPVEDEKKLKPSSYKMDPYVHSAVIYLAKKMDLFELYSSKGKLIMKKSSKEKVCLVKHSSLLRKARKASLMEPETLQTVFNSSERFPDFTFKWFRSMESLRVLYLGRWERNPARQIEVLSTEYFRDIRALKNLRLASFQGILGVRYIENSICELRELVILDLRECYDLQILPEDIGLLENLVYLDASNCFKLDHMPKGVANLSRLQVLKGFVIGPLDYEENCAFKHLVNLRKLSITIKNNRFKVENLMESLKDLTRLESLKIAWRIPRREETSKREEYIEITKEDKENQKGPSSLKKLELESFPYKDPPRLLNPKNLDKLEKLSIKGGGLSRIIDEHQWPVQILRLKHLHEFKIEWKELQALFPKMLLLEKYQCPKVTFCPTDGNGFWRRSQDYMVIESKDYSSARAQKTKPTHEKVRIQKSHSVPQMVMVSGGGHRITW